jgi:hypothetical protein
VNEHTIVYMLGVKIKQVSKRGEYLGLSQVFWIGVYGMYIIMYDFFLRCWNNEKTLYLKTITQFAYQYIPKLHQLHKA